ERELAGVEAGGDVEMGRRHRLTGGTRRLDGLRRRVEAREEAVARGGDLGAAAAGNLAAYRQVVLLEQRTPRRVPESLRMSGGVDDVGEQHRRQRAARFPSLPTPPTALVHPPRPPHS